MRKTRKRMNLGGEEAMALTGLASARTGFEAARTRGTIAVWRMPSFGFTGRAQGKTFINDG